MIKHNHRNILFIYNYISCHFRPRNNKLQKPHFQRKRNNTIYLDHLPYHCYFFFKMPRSIGRKTAASTRITEVAEILSDAQSKCQRLNSQHNAARTPLRTEDVNLLHRLKPFTAKCQHCFALHWVEEKTQKSSMKNPLFSMCCASGKVTLPAPVYPPQQLTKYLLDQTQSE